MKGILDKLLILTFVVWISNSMLAQSANEYRGEDNPPLPNLVKMTGIVKQQKVAPCAETFGNGPLGVHLIVGVEILGEIDVHIGPETNVKKYIDKIGIGRQLTFEAFREDFMPEKTFIAKTLEIRPQNQPEIDRIPFDENGRREVLAGKIVYLRDRFLRPYWAGLISGKDPIQKKPADLSGKGWCWK